MGVYRGGKHTTSSYRELDIRWLHREGILDRAYQSRITWSRGGEVTASIGVCNRGGNLELEYSSTRWNEDRKHFCYLVSLDWTKCNYGGTRPWFICPAESCYRRVAVLYGGSIFACRQCHGIVYESQHEAPHYRALNRFHKIIERLGGQPGEGIPGKPKGMQWRTYERLHREAERAEMLSFPPWLLRS